MEATSDGCTSRIGRTVCFHNPHLLEFQNVRATQGGERHEHDLENREAATNDVRCGGEDGREDEADEMKTNEPPDEGKEWQQGEPTGTERQRGQEEVKDEQREEDQHGKQGRGRLGAWVEARSMEETAGTDESIASVCSIGLNRRFVRSPRGMSFSRRRGSKCRKMDNRWNRRWDSMHKG